MVRSENDLVECCIFNEKIDEKVLRKNFVKEGDNDVLNLWKIFVSANNDSEKTSTTYCIKKGNIIISFFRLSFMRIENNSKNREFFTQQQLNSNYYSTVNLEFIIRNIDSGYNGFGEVIFTQILEIIKEVNSKICLKYLYIKSIKKRVPYFTNKGFKAIKEKSKKCLKDGEQLEMLAKLNFGKIA